MVGCQYSVEPLGALPATLVWHKLEPFARKALDALPTEHTVQSLQEDVAAGFLIPFLIMGEDDLAGVAFVRLEDRPTARVCQVAGIAGQDMQQWLSELFDRVSTFCTAERCQVLEVTGRTGWIKSLRPFGFEHELAVVRKYF